MLMNYVQLLYLLWKAVFIVHPVLPRSSRQHYDSEIQAHITSSSLYSHEKGNEMQTALSSSLHKQCLTLGIFLYIEHSFYSVEENISFFLILGFV